MLVLILFSFLLLAPALQGVWDFRTQFVFEAAVFLTGGLWLFRESLAGGLSCRLFEKRNIPLWLAAFFSLLAAALSPVRALVMPEWWTFAAGIFILTLAGCLKAGERRWTDMALRLSAWLVALLSLYQAFILKSSDISASLTNPNALALFTLMLLPLAIVWKDFVLMVALVITLLWTQSEAALLALLVAAGFYAKDNMKAEDVKKNLPVFLLMAAIAALALSQLELRSFLDRFGWWHAALRMFADRPALGFGPGAFAYVYPAYHGAYGSGLSTIYVHNYYLEFLAENGFFAFIFWGWAVAARVRETSGLKKYALIAALAHSFTDFGLAVPANFFVFCYLLTGPAGDEPAVRPTARWQAAAAAAMGLLLAAHMSGVFFRKTAIEALYFSAMKAYSAGECSAAEGFLETAHKREPGNPVIPQILGQIRMREGFERKEMPMLFRAAVSYERALALNPYNAAAYRDLRSLYLAAGEEKMAADLLARKREVFRWER